MSVDTSKMVFVFGSNEGGIHGAGAARYAHKQRGAVWGVGYGHTGSTFAIPTKAIRLSLENDNPVIGPTLALNQIREYVNAFLRYARARRDLQFQVTAIGCGLAGLRHEDIAPMFANAPYNCWFDEVWLKYMPMGGSGYPKHRFWGTF